MKVTSSYGVEIRKAEGALSTTLKIYREAVRVLALFYDTVWEDISAVEGEKKRFNYAEHLVHNTKKNRAVYDFDSLFPKMPSYLRRSAVTHWERCHRTGPGSASGRKAEERVRALCWGKERMRCPFSTGGTCIWKEKGTQPSSSFTAVKTGYG